MQRAITLLTLIILTISPVFGLTLEGGVTYTVESARKEAFSGVKYKIPVSSFKKYMQDPNFEENKAAIAAGKADLGDRCISYFSDGTYSIIYSRNKYRVYTYSPNGKLEEISIRTSLNLPMKAYKYDISGELVGVEFYVSKREIYIYDVNGNCVSYWDGSNCYNQDGKIILRLE